jgi:hypothetical protein
VHEWQQFLNPQGSQIHSAATQPHFNSNPVEENTLNDEENGVFNELGDVFSMFFNIDSDEAVNPTQNHVPAGNELLETSSAIPPKVLLPRSSSSTSNVAINSTSEGISPKGMVGYPSMSPATINWLQSLATSASCDSLSGLVSPATLSVGGFTPTLPNVNNNPSQAGMTRTPSCELIDWRAFNESQVNDKAQKDVKWKVIPQHGPHAESTVSSTNLNEIEAEQTGGIRDHISRQFHTIKTTVASIVGALSTEAPSGVAEQHAPSIPPRIPAVSQSEIDRIDEETNKRKALISPEYVQYGSNTNTSQVALEESSLLSVEDAMRIKGNIHEKNQLASVIPDPTGRRPSKKSLHQVILPVNVPPLPVSNEEPVIRCKCTGKCRNARCACVKAGHICGVQCKCVRCCNPFVPMMKEGIDIQKMAQDICLMQYLSKVKDMSELLESYVSYECCSGAQQVQVKTSVENGFECPKCHSRFTYSWCSNRLCHDQKKPRKHCEKCRRCGDHRNDHCDDCNHCYFAGVANSFSCSCKANSSTNKVRSVVPNTFSAVSNTNFSPFQQEPPTDMKPEVTVKETAIGEKSNPLNEKQKRSYLKEELSLNEAKKEDSCPVQ